MLGMILLTQERNPRRHIQFVYYYMEMDRDEYDFT